MVRCIRTANGRLDCIWRYRAAKTRRVWGEMPWTCDSNWPVVVDGLIVICA
jgi:hypothetical protein